MSFSHALPAVRTHAFPFTISRTLATTLLIALALPPRIMQLGATGFSEDEINKWNAVRAYRGGDFSANAEHPMLMKLAQWASLSAAGAWNAHQHDDSPARVSDETALRLPNAVAGAATAGIVFLLAEALFDTAVGWWAAAFWALDPNAIAINRIGKEDTLLLAFLLLGALLYERGRHQDTSSGASFGLMLASKYMPHYFGLHALFAYLANPRRLFSKPARGPLFFVAMAAAFLIANPAIFLPQTWRYLLGYVGGDAVHHTGYVFAGHLYVNSMQASPWGTPPWFYLTFIAAKVPVVVLGFAAVGLAWIWRHPATRGAVFVRIFLVFTLLPCSLVAGKFVRYMLPMLAMIDIAAAVGATFVLKRIAAPAIVAAAVVAVLAADIVLVAPHFPLAQNVVGKWMGPAGSLFPDDEFYDAGVREAVATVAAAAAPGAVLCSEASKVVAEYLARNRRSDITACSIARDGMPMHASDVWLLDQDGHRYFETESTVDAIRRRLKPFAEEYVGGSVAVRVFRLEARSVEPVGQPQSSRRGDR